MRLKANKKATIIAEVGNNHEGSISLAKFMILSAQRAGADLVKLQAGKAAGFARTADRIKYYKRFELGLQGYISLLKFGEKIGIPVFFSIWSPEMERLRGMEKWHKIPARQYNRENLGRYDYHNTFISIPENAANGKILGIPLHVVSEYPAYDAKLENIKVLKMRYGEPVGYSDHTIGISTCITAVRNFGAQVIEKHFTLGEIKKKSKFRDHIHSATFEEFKIMVDTIRGLTL